MKQRSVCTKKIFPGDQARPQEPAKGCVTKMMGTSCKFIKRKGARTQSLEEVQKDLTAVRGNYRY